MRSAFGARDAEAAGDKDETNGNADHGDKVERARREGVLRDPDKAGRREHADHADRSDEQTEHESQRLHGAPVAGFTIIIETLATANQITSSPWPIIVT